MANFGVDRNTGAGGTGAADTTVFENLEVTFDASIGRDLTVGDDATITGDAAVGGALTVTGNADVDGDLEVGGNITIDGVNIMTNLKAFAVAMAVALG